MSPTDRKLKAITAYDLLQEARDTGTTVSLYICNEQGECLAAVVAAMGEDAAALRQALEQSTRGTETETLPARWRVGKD